MSLSEIKQVLSPRASVADPKTIAALQKALNDRKQEFERQMTKLSNGISEIDALLEFLSQCDCRRKQQPFVLQKLLAREGSSDQASKQS